MITLNWKSKAAIATVTVLAIFTGFAQVHGGVRVMAKAQLECIGEGQSVQMDSKYSYIWNTCAINRGTDESPKWVISKRDVGVEGVE